MENFRFHNAKNAEQHSNALISFDDFNTPVSTGTYSDVPQHEKFEHVPSIRWQQAIGASGNFGHLLARCVCAFRLWDDRFTPASGEAGILDYPRDVPHRWAYFQVLKGQHSNVTVTPLNKVASLICRTWCSKHLEIKCTLLPKFE